MLLSFSDVACNQSLVCVCVSAQMLDAIKAFAHDLVESDLVIFYFSGHARSAQGINYLVPSGGPTDNLDTANKFATRGLYFTSPFLHLSSPIFLSLTHTLSLSMCV